MELGKRTEALEYYRSTFGCDYGGECYDNLALAQFKIGYFYRDIDKDSSKRYYDEAFLNSQKGMNLATAKIIADTLCSFAVQENDYKSAYKYQSFAKKANDSIQKFRQEAALSEWETKFEFERINKENRAKQEELVQQKTQRNGALGISILLIIFVLIVFINYRRKQKDNKLLLAQKNEIESISKRLHEADQAKLKIFTNISHELRTPLTLIIAPLVRLFKKESNESIKQEYSLIIRNARKLQNLIDQLLDIAKIDKAALSINPELHDLKEQVRIIASMFHSLAQEKNIDFKVTISHHDLVFEYDAKRMEQIINNLLSNAFKFTPQDGKISITVTREEEKAIIKINNTGIGITPDNIDKVFDRFFQSNDTRSWHIEGSGIGLSLAKELVELHHGEISIESDPGNWTEFVITIPIQRTSIQTTLSEYHPSIIVVENFHDHKKEISQSDNKISQETILLVEDNPDLRSYLSRSLSDKYNVIEAADGHEGITQAKKEMPDIIISDVMMPGTDGYQLTSTIRSQVETCHIPIILLTAKIGRDNKIEGLERGADDYIYKPFDEDEIHLKVNNILLNRQKLQESFKKKNLATPSSIEVKSMDEQFIAKLVTVIELNILDNQFSVDVLADNIGLSRQQLYRKLKAISGRTPAEFIRSVRIQRAAQLIAQNAAPIGEIAFLTGFENLSYFSKRFKEEYGVLPSEYGKVEV